MTFTTVPPNTDTWAIPNPQTQTPQTNPDSTTNVYKLVPMDRTTVSVRIRPELKQALKSYCRTNGLSLCHVFEGLVTGFLVGVHQQIEFVNKSPTMNVSVVREVKRVRRYAVEETVTESVSGVCVVCGRAAFASCRSKDGSRLLCKEHFQKAKSRLLGWKYVPEHIGYAQPTTANQFLKEVAMSNRLPVAVQKRVLGVDSVETFRKQNH